MALRLSSIMMILLGMFAPQQMAFALGISEKVQGEVKWGEPFSHKLSDGIYFEVELLGKVGESKDGIYISVLNKKKPRDRQFVIIPEVENGHEINFIGVEISPHDKPIATSKDLHLLLSKLSGIGTEMMYYTDMLNSEDQDGLNAPGHFQPAEVYAKKNAVIDHLHKVKIVFKILSFTLSDENDPKTPAHIQNLKFSVDIGGK